jgi:phage gp36-like protein
MIALCTPEDVKKWLLQNYVDAAVGINPTIVEETIESVSGEVWELLSYRYAIPTGNIPTVLCNIAGVFSAYRIMEAITGIVATEAGADNVWIPLQREYQRMDRMLQDIAKGVIKLDLPDLMKDREDPSMAIVAPKPELDLSKF